MKSLLVLAFFTGVTAFADVPGTINNLTSVVGGWGGATAALAAIAEFVMRIIPSNTPLSIAWVVANSLQALSGLFAALAKFLDSFLPQNTK